MSFIALTILSSIYLHSFSIFVVEKVPNILKDKLNFIIAEVKQSYKEKCSYFLKDFLNKS